MGTQDLHLDPGLAHRADGARMQHAGAHRGELLGFGIGEGADLPGSAGQPRIGREEAGHIGPDLDPLGGQLGGEIARRGIRSAATKQGRVAILAPGDEALGYDGAGQAGALIAQPVIPIMGAINGQIAPRA